MKILSTIQREATAKSALSLLALPSAILFGAMFRFACQEIDIIGQGPHGVASAACIGFFTFAWVRKTQQKHAERRGPDFFRKTAAIIGIAFVALPFCVLTGRLVFSFVPFIWSDSFGAFVGYFVSLRIPDILLARSTDQKTEVERGSSVIQAPELLGGEQGSTETAATASGGGTFRWAGHTHAEPIFEGNLLVVGARGTGKTLQTREHMRSWLPFICPMSGRLAVIYDVKGDLVSEIDSMGLACPHFIMNPYDQRSWAWDIGRDIKSPADVKQLVEVLFPEPLHSESRHWTTSARDIVGGIVNRFNERRAGKWSLRDLVRVSTFKDRMEPLLRETDLVSYFKPDVTFNNTINTIRTVMSELESVAALWAAVPSERRLSLKQFVKEKDAVLILGGPEDLQASLSLINRVMFRQLTECIMAEPESPGKSRFVFYCDEAKHAGRLDLPKFINTRSKGGRVVLGFQDLPGLYSVYGKPVAMEIVGGFHTVSFLKITEIETAQWASRVIGEAMYIEDIADPLPEGGEGKPHRNRVKREAVLPSEIMNLRTFGDGRVEGFHRFMGTEHAVRQIVRYPFHKTDPTRDFQRRPSEQEKLAEWTEDDSKRFGTKKEDQNKSENGERPKPKEPPPPPPPDLDSFGRFEF